MQTTRALSVARTRSDILRHSGAMRSIEPDLGFRGLVLAHHPGMTITGLAV